MKELLLTTLFMLTTPARATSETDKFVRVTDNDMCMIQLGNIVAEFDFPTYGMGFAIPDTEEKAKRLVDEAAGSLKWISAGGWKSEKEKGNYEIYNPEAEPFYYQIFKSDKNAKSIYAYVIVGKAGGCIVYTSKSRAILPLLFKKTP